MVSLAKKQFLVHVKATPRHTPSHQVSSGHGIELPLRPMLTKGKCHESPSLITTTRFFQITLMLCPMMKERVFSSPIH
jgi:hypothetical protein